MLDAYSSLSFTVMVSNLCMDLLLQLIVDPVILLSSIHHGISAIFIIPEHPLPCHPYFGESFLNAGRFDAEADDLSDSDEDLQNHADTQVQRPDRDRPNNFVIDESKIWSVILYGDIACQRKLKTRDIENPCDCRSSA
jgi:hypothetical protein